MVHEIKVCFKVSLVWAKGGERRNMEKRKKEWYQIEKNICENWERRSEKKKRKSGLREELEMGGRRKRNQSKKRREKRKRRK